MGNGHCNSSELRQEHIIGCHSESFNGTVAELRGACTSLCADDSECLAFTTVQGSCSCILHPHRAQNTTGLSKRTNDTAATQCFAETCLPHQYPGNSTQPPLEASSGQTLCNHAVHETGEGRVAIGCNSAYTPNVQMALANGMFGSSDGMRRDCNATCLFDVRAPSTVAYTWDANRTCWLGQVLSYFLSNVSCPHRTPASAYIDSLVECGEAVAYLASNRTDGRILLGTSAFAAVNRSSGTTSGKVFPYQRGALIPIWQDAAALPLCFLAGEHGGSAAHYYRPYFNSLRVTTASGYNATKSRYVCKPATPAVCFGEQQKVARAYAEARSSRMCALKNLTSVVPWWRNGACCPVVELRFIPNLCLCALATL